MQTKLGSRPCERCTRCGCYGTNNKISRRIKTWLAQILSFAWRLVWYVMNSMLVKLATHFPKDSQRIAVIETNRLQNW